MTNTRASRNISSASRSPGHGSLIGRTALEGRAGPPLNAPIREEGDPGEWQDWLVDESASQETRLGGKRESDNRRKALASALSVLNERERRIFEARRLAASMCARLR
jgi:hypothetical protein